jgi:ABC-type Zn2+ transport system substrate-binding protein/surface adhesin
MAASPSPIARAVTLSDRRCEDELDDHEESLFEEELREEEEEEEEEEEDDEEEDDDEVEDDQDDEDDDEEDEPDGLGECGSSNLRSACAAASSQSTQLAKAIANGAQARADAYIRAPSEQELYRRRLD